MGTGLESLFPALTAHLISQTYQNINQRLKHYNMDAIRKQQAQNFINICKGAPLGTIIRALELQTHQFEYIAEILGCKPELNSIAAAIIK